MYTGESAVNNEKVLVYKGKRGFVSDSQVFLGEIVILSNETVALPGKK